MDPWRSIRLVVRKRKSVQGATRSTFVHPDTISQARSKGRDPNRIDTVYEYSFSINFHHILSQETLTRRSEQNGGATSQHIHAQPPQVVRNVDENSLLGQLVVFPPVNVHHAHLGCAFGSRQAHESLPLVHDQVRPAAPAAVGALGVLQHVADEDDVVEARSERPLVLYPVALDGVGSQVSGPNEIRRAGADCSFAEGQPPDLPPAGTPSIHTAD